MISKRTRILVLINNLRFGGAETMTLNILNRMNHDKYENIVCCLGGSEELRMQYERSGYKIIYLNTRSKGIIVNIAALLSVIRNEQIDIISAHLTPSIIYGSICGKLMRKPVIATLHSQSTAKSKRLIAIERVFLSLCDRVIAISECVKKDIVQDYKINERNVRLIWNGSDAEAFNPKKYQVDTEYELFRSKWGVSKGSFVIGTVASFKPQKNHRGMVYCLAELKKVIPEVKCVFIGDGPLRVDIETLVDSLGLKGDVIFTGNQNEIPKFMFMMDLYVSSSISEGFCIALVEAMLMEKAVVATNVGSMADIVENGITGLLVEPDNTKQLAEAIHFIYKDKDKILTMGKNGRKRALTLFDINNTAAQFQITVDELANKSGTII